MRETFSLRYTGKQLRTGMDAEDVAAAIQGFAAMARVAGAAIYGDQPHIDFKVQTVRTGSLSIGFLMEVAGVTKTLLGTLPDGPVSVTDFVGLIKDWVGLMKHLGGKPPTKIQKMSKSAGVQIQNAQGDIKIVQNFVFNSFNSHDVGRHAESFARPLRRKADNLEIRVGRKTAAKVTKKDAPAFKSVRKAEEMLEQINTVFLKVVAPVFEGNGMWRFSRGRNTITASIDDPKFLADVQTGHESFRAGDILKVRLRSSQERLGDSIKDHHVVVEVLSHERPDGGRQAKLV